MKPDGLIASNLGEILRIPWFGRGYYYFNMTNYFKMNNYFKFYGKTFIVMTAIMSDNSELPGYADFTREVFYGLANQNREHIHVTLEFCFTPS